LLAAAHGCATGSRNANESPASSPAAASNPATAPGADPLEDITRSMRAQMEVRSFRVRMEFSYSGSGNTRTVEFVAPDRFHMTSDKNEVIIVGPATYMKTPKGTWQKIPMDVNAMIQSFRDPQIIDEVRKSTNATFVGPDTLDGSPMLVYQYTMSNAFGTNSTSTTKSWISASDGLPRRLEIDGEINAIKARAVNTYYDYNAEIKIEPPM
jgi:outer membrane lipoprotein-sorting protein